MARNYAGTNLEINRYAPFQYTPEGKRIMERLWQETMDEFKIVDATGILASI